MSKHIAVVTVQCNSTNLHTWHADAGKLSNAVQASGIILAWHGEALVDVNLTSRASISPAALALEGALCVYTFSEMLTRVGTCGSKGWASVYKTHPVKQADHQSTENCK